MPAYLKTRFAFTLKYVPGDIFYSGNIGRFPQVALGGAQELNDISCG